MTWIRKWLDALAAEDNGRTGWGGYAGFVLALLVVVAMLGTLALIFWLGGPNGR